MDWSLRDLASRPRVAVLASRQGHCLADLLVAQRARRARRRVRARRVEPRHARALVERFDVPFRHLPVDTPDRAAQERALGALLDETAPDVVVLARYMRVLPLARRRVEAADDQHPSLVPAVVRRRASVRAGPRARREGDRRDRALRHARARRRPDHRPAGAAGLAPRRPDRLERRGRDLEAVVLAEALRLHLEHRVIVYGRRTAVFD
jgi:formyltetrahydrofolate deformylase